MFLVDVGDGRSAGRRSAASPPGDDTQMAWPVRRSMFRQPLPSSWFHLRIRLYDWLWDLAIELQVSPF